MPGQRVPGREGIHESIDGLLLGEAEQLADDRLGDGVAGAREHLVEHRLGVPHAARRQRAMSATRLGLHRRAPPPARMRVELAGRSPRGESGRNVKRWRRDTTAGRIWLGSVVQKTKTTPSGGSSSVLSRTSQPSLMRWTSSMMNTLRRRSDAAV